MYILYIYIHIKKLERSYFSLPNGRWRWWWPGEWWWWWVMYASASKIEAVMVQAWLNIILYCSSFCGSHPYLLDHKYFERYKGRQLRPHGDKNTLTRIWIVKISFPFTHLFLSFPFFLKKKV